MQQHPDSATAAANPLEQPDDGGLAPRGPGLAGGGPFPAAAPRRTSEVIDAAAAGESISDAEQNDLLAYFLTNDKVPGDDEAVELEVTLGNGDRKRAFRFKVTSIEWSAYQDARERAMDAKTGDFDAFLSSSWVVARALKEPKLGPAVARAQRENPETAPTDGAHLLRRMFKSQPGALLELSAKVLELSKLQGDQGTVREVEAGKR